MRPPFRLASAGFVAASLLAGTALCSSAQASPVPFNFNFTYGGSSGTLVGYEPNGAGTLLSNATQVSEGTTQTILTIDSVSGPAAGAVNDSINYIAAPMVVPSGQSGVMADGLSIKWDTYTFTSLYGTYSRDSGQDALAFLWSGTFTDSSGVLAAQNATFSQSWSQAAPGIQPSTAGTFNSNVSIVIPSVPEPGAMWLLATGLLGLVLTQRRRRPAA